MRDGDGMQLTKRGDNLQAMNIVSPLAWVEVAPSRVVVTWAGLHHDSGGCRGCFENEEPGLGNDSSLDHTCDLPLQILPFPSSTSGLVQAHLTT